MTDLPGKPFRTSYDVGDTHILAENILTNLKRTEIGGSAKAYFPKDGIVVIKGDRRRTSDLLVHAARRVLNLSKRDYERRSDCDITVILGGGQARVDIRDFQDWKEHPYYVVEQTLKDKAIIGSVFPVEN
jgi:hypothetical protein